MHISVKHASVAGAVLASLAIGGGTSLAASVPSTTALALQHPAMRQVLQEGSKGHWVMTLQADLALLGYTQVGPMDGIFGPKTQAAVRAFEAQHGFAQNGVTSAPVWQDILAGFKLTPPVPSTDVQTNASSAQSLEQNHPAMRQVLEEGATGHWVMTLQADLALLGYTQVGPMDGIFGPKTKAALEAFQRQHGFSATGVTSPRVWQEMLAGFGITPPVSGTGPVVSTGSGSSASSTSQTVGPVLPASFPQGGTPVEEPSLASPSDGVMGAFTPNRSTIDGRPVLRAYHMVATAYAPSLADNYPYGPQDYFGQPLEDGMIAVDPHVIPLRSVVYVTGYHDNFLPAGGFLGQAMDTGGAIQGDRIDIFINQSENAVNDFGVQQVKVYVLGS